MKKVKVFTHHFGVIDVMATFYATDNGILRLANASLARDPDDGSDELVAMFAAGQWSYLTIEAVAS